MFLPSWCPHPCYLASFLARYLELEDTSLLWGPMSEQIPPPASLAQAPAQAPVLFCSLLPHLFAFSRRLMRHYVWNYKLLRLPITAPRLLSAAPSSTRGIELGAVSRT